MNNVEQIDIEADKFYRELQQMHRTTREYTTLLEKVKGTEDVRKQLIGLGKEIGKARGKSWEVQRIFQLKEKEKSLKELEKLYESIITKFKGLSEKVKNLQDNPEAETECELTVEDIKRLEVNPIYKALLVIGIVASVIITIWVILNWN